MNLIISAPTWLIVLLLVLLIAAAVEDAMRFRISNLTCAAVLLTALVAMAFAGFSSSLWQNVVVFIVILALGTAAFAAGWLGGGDVKLLAVLGLWFDLRAAVGLLAAVFIAGGAVALIYIAARWVRLRSQDTDRKSRRVPYGLAIATGGIILFAMQLQARPDRNAFIEEMHAKQAAEHR